MHENEIYMHRALELAKRGAPNVSPNPMVGAVIVRGGKIIAEGWHKKYGGAHAEMEAIRVARERKISLTGATFYVNLEPCIHENKKTPPCVPELIKAGFNKVVVAIEDPNPHVSGKGIAALRKAGIRVEVGLAEDTALELNEKFVHWMTAGTPFVGLKIGMSLDGKIATRTGNSKWITSPLSREYVHALRDQYDAILVGITTVMKDNPELTGKKREPIRIILDSALKIPPNSRVLRDMNVWVIVTSKATASKISVLKRRGIRIKIFPKKITIPPLLRFLGQQNISSLFIEGGSEVFGSFVDSRAINKVHWFISPKIIGGAEAKPAVSGTGVARVNDALTLKNFTVQKIGNDLLIEGHL